ncbi:MULTISPECIES: alpha-1,6-glucosidase domain-containing protein [unclassified Duganella]|uniref:alpha-1,6-glucosidase domain-containing protein n=1 Tax=unclassified Duganella TaxID=2636909 RepID=UPI00088AE762|nr:MULTISPECIES: alpha-1,6-glucosidase domain-containing protein [unclassified Duganella]SDF97043.1 alpha-1,6-glucosidases, pullulanase-type [Duganella sp. OV458]SDJ07654.1 alpha-1,6-glucosidases, pullulanase-type [Duganella sp. OV510]
MAGKHVAVVGLGGALALSCLTAVAAPSLAECDGAFATTLNAAPAVDARAYWLNRQLIKWPSAATDGVFKLYYSAGAQLRAARGARVTGADGAVTLSRFEGAVPADAAQRFKFVGAGPVLAAAQADVARLLTQQVLLVQEAADGTVRDATSLQIAGALDDIYAGAAQADDLGVTVGKRDAGFKLWAPTAQNVALCTYDSGSSKAAAITPMTRDAATGIWSASAGRDGQYYQYLVDVVAPSAGLVRNLVTDPYSVSLTTDSKRSYIVDLNAAKLKPAGWDKTAAPAKVAAQTDMTVYELHVRDFSINDHTVSAANRGKYTAFTETKSNGMKHLAALSKAGMTDIHLLPVYDIGSVPEQGCVVPQIPPAAPDSDTQQAAVEKVKFQDCYNWGYDPYHYNAPEGSYSTDPANGAKRIIEFRQMVQALHKAGLRVGMDVVYNHTYIAGQNEKSVLDRVVPGYYHRLNAKGDIERSTCCDNTATENLMMGKLMVDSTALWVKHYKIDSFRFDLMGHQPRATMEQLQARVGKQINLIGEGWNFGEVADGARFVQASQLSLNGSGIGTFSDRGRDAVRGGGAGDSGVQLITQQGYINGLVYDANEQASRRPLADLLQASDMVKAGLAGTIRSYPLTTTDGRTVALQDIVYGGNQPAGYASEPGETVNYVENHDNQTLYDINAFKLPQATTARERAQVQMLGAAINAFSQGVAYFHAGFDILRSKSLDRNSFESGDWFNRLDWTYQDNYYGTGLPPAADNSKDYALIKPILRNAAIKPAPADIAWARDAFRDLLSIRSSSTLFRLRSSEDIKQRLRFFNNGPQQVATVIAAHIDGKGYPGARFKSIIYLINVDKTAQTITVAEEKNRNYALHPVHTGIAAADKRVASEARYDKTSGSYTIPARSAVVFVEH